MTDQDWFLVKKSSPRWLTIKKFGRQLSSDLDRSLGGWGFWLAALSIAMAILAAGGKELFPKAEDIAKGLNAGYHRTLFQSGLTGEALIFLLPLVSTLPYAASWLDERKNGYWKAYMVRTGRERYVLSRILANALGGGLSCLLGYWLAYLFLALIYRPMEAEAAGTASWLPALHLTGGAIFLMGALWAGIGLFFSLSFRNRYMIYGGPFLLSYLLVILTTRYLPAAYTLNPREWLTMSHYWEGGGAGVIGFLLELVGITAVLEYLLLKWRLKP